MNEVIMEPTNAQNQGYWFVVREDQGNVIFSSNNINIQNPQIASEQETRYIIDIDASAAGTRHYAQVAAEPVVAQDDSECSERGSKRSRHIKQEDAFWDRNKVKLLLTLCLENKTVDKDTLWDEISNIIGATAEECNTKYRHLRRTYLRLLKKKRLGKDIKWIHYNICEEVFTDLRALPSSVLEPWEDANVRKLLNLYLENLQRFRNPNCLQKDIWREIAMEIGTTGYNCYHKFRSLRRSYLNWLNRNRETGKSLKWPYQQYFDRIYYDFKPCNRPWDRNKIKQLLDAYAQIAHKFRNPKLQKKELWKEIARKVGENPSACDKKFRNLKQTYTRLKIKTDSGRSIIKWRYYRDFENIYTSSMRSLDLNGVPKVDYHSRQDDYNYIHQLLEFYLSNKEKFRDPLTKNRTLWKTIAPKLGLTPEECDKKFRNLKQTYFRLAWKKKQTGNCSTWPYLSYFERIYESGPSIDHSGCSWPVESSRAVSERRFERLVRLTEQSNQIQRDRNTILQALLDRK